MSLLDSIFGSHFSSNKTSSRIELSFLICIAVSILSKFFLKNHFPLPCMAGAAAILEEPRGPRAGRLAFGQLDLSPPALRFRLLGNRHFQNALFELRFGVLAVDPLRQRHGAVKVTIAALPGIVVALFLFLPDLLPPFQPDHVVCPPRPHLLLLH